MCVIKSGNLTMCIKSHGFFLCQPYRIPVMDSIRYQCHGVTKVPKCDRSLAYGESVQLLSPGEFAELSGNLP